MFGFAHRVEKNHWRKFLAPTKSQAMSADSPTLPISQREKSFALCRWLT
jgi:hypothetical protein